MDTHGDRATLLGKQIAKRLGQLGMSRRELCRRVNISRQTMHELEHNFDKGFADSTFDALDRGLKWQAGTARAFHQGNQKARDEVGAMSTEERINKYLDEILRLLATMDIDELEREVLMLEEESSGRTESPNGKTSKLIRRQIDRIVAAWKHEVDNHQRSVG